MRIAVYGGSFNPPHLGHQAAAAAAVRRLKADRLLLIPAGIPPHKALAENTPPAEHRLAMTQYMAERIALDTGVEAEVLRLEIDRAGKSFTVDTLRALRAQHPDDELWLLMGSDMFLSFHTWRAPEEILGYAGLCAFSRSRSDESAAFARQQRRLRAAYPGARIKTLTVADVVEVSSTELRAALPQGGGAAYLDPAVYGYLLREHLYGTNLDLERLTIEELRPIAMSYLKAKRRAHVLGTEATAAALAQRYGADVEKARVAALLHDSTKRFSPQEQLALCERYGIAPDEGERRAPRLLHAVTGAALARSVFGADEEICGAIRWHTTGRPGMTLLEKIIYLADYMEPTRDFDGVEELRRAVWADLDGGLLLAFTMSLEETGENAHHNTVNAREDLLRRMKDHGTTAETQQTTE